MTSELDYVRSSMQGLIERTARPARTMRNFLILTNRLGVPRSCPCAGASRTQVGTVATELANWTGAFDDHGSRIFDRMRNSGLVCRTFIATVPQHWRSVHLERFGRAQIIADTGLT